MKPTNFFKLFISTISTMGISSQIQRFSTKITNLFFKFFKVPIQKIIGYGWVHVHKEKLCGRSLKVSRIQDKPNLDKIFKSYLEYCDLKGLHTRLLKRFMK